MYSIVQNELIKLFARKKVYVFMAILFIITLVSGLAVYIMSSHLPLAKPGQDSLSMSAQAFPLTILDAMGNTIAIFLIILVADMLTEEYIAGTLKLPLMRPVTRGQLLAGKVLALFLVTVLLHVFVLVTSYIVGTILLGWSGSFIYAQATIPPLNGILMTIGSYFLAIFPVFAFGMIALLFSILLTSSGSVIGIAIGALFSQSIISQVSKQYRPYMILNYFKLYTPIFTKDWAFFLQGIVVTLVYGVVFYLMSYYLLKRKDLLS